MKVLETGRVKMRAEQIAAANESCGQSPSQRYQIRWQEIYEFSAEIEASSYEEALKQAGLMLGESAMLTDLTEWRCGDDEDTAHSTTSAGHEIEASFESQGIVECLPAADDEDDEDAPKAHVF